MYRIPLPFLQMISLLLDLSGLSDTASVTITVLDENDNTPIFEKTFFNTEYPYMELTGMSAPVLLVIKDAR